VPLERVARHHDAGSAWEDLREGRRLASVWRALGGDLHCRRPPPRPTDEVDLPTAARAPHAERGGNSPPYW